jgi:predicted 3-demethylubiquinone-9 3-methyltransferase (glyoxalase superfamily)
MEKITPCFWCDGNAEELAKFYTSLFKSSKITDVSHYPTDHSAGPGKKGQVLTVGFELEGRSYIALNGGPHYKPTPAISFYVSCDSQQEVDLLWEKLLADGGVANQCGWLTDKFGVSWQIVPRQMIEMIQDPDTARVARVMAVMMKMVKLDLARLEAAYRSG